MIPDPILNYPNNLRSAYSTSRYPVDNGKSEMGPGMTHKKADYRYDAQKPDYRYDAQKPEYRYDAQKPDYRYDAQKSDQTKIQILIPGPILDYPSNLRSAYCTSRCPVGNGKSEMGSGMTTSTDPGAPWF
jgi:hypothetical protein